MQGKLPLGFLRSKHARILTFVLVLQAVLFYTLSRGEAVPIAEPLSAFPTRLGDWVMVEEGVIEQAIRDVLRADDLLNRTYANPATRQVAGLFVAYFKSQRTGQAPHSPKNCLPGHGWVPSESGFLEISIPGEPAPILVNRYIVSRGDSRSLVLYWYQSRDRVIASEYKAKIYLVADAIRYNRTDTALVRIVVPMRRDGEQEATDAAVAFVQSFFGRLREHLPF